MDLAGLSVVHVKRSQSGVGHHEPETPGNDAQYETFARSNHGISDEQDLVTTAFSYIDELDGDVLVGYNGIDFDMDFLAKRCAIWRRHHQPSRHRASISTSSLTERQRVAQAKSGPRLKTVSTVTGTRSRRRPETASRSIIPASATSLGQHF